MASGASDKIDRDRVCYEAAETIERLDRISESLARQLARSMTENARLKNELTKR
jgi:phosphate uptake regulator